MKRSVLVLVGVVVIGATSASNAQVSWDVFEDAQSTSACDIVNTTGNELVVLSSTNELMLVGGVDTILSDTFVDADSFVFFLGDPAGSIEFAEDADGFRTLWWLAFDGRAIELDALTLEPLVSDLFPEDFTNVDCDACDFIDNPPIGVCDSNIVIDICGTGIASNAFLTMSFCGFVGLRLTRRW